MLKISANDAQLTVVACGPITSDRIDLPCEITLSKEFDGLAVTVVFKAGDVQRDVAMLGSPVNVPAECLEQAGEVLMVGIWAGDGSGRPTIPTVWASAGTIRTGALPSGYDPEEPEPDWAAQVQQAAAQAVATANSVREDADAGVFDGEDGYSPSATVEQLADGATITITDKDGTTTATVHDGADGRDGRDGTDGVDGFSPTATVTQTATGATISITDKSGTTTASVSNGTDGTDGTDGVDGFSPTVDVQPITGGHEVTITDADGPHSFDVMDGDPAEPGSITDEMLASDGIKAQVAQLFGNQLVGEMSGTIDTASDAYAAPPMALTVDGASTQAGTPTPDAPVPILSVDDLSLVMAGKNLLDRSTEESGYIQSDGSVRYTAGWLASPHVPVVSGATYTFNPNSTAGGSAKGCFYYADKTPIVASIFSSGPITITAPADARFVRFSYRDTSTNVQLELGSTATAYEPYSGVTAPIDLQGHELRSLPDDTNDRLDLTYDRPSSRKGWAWYKAELMQVVNLLDLGSINWVKDSNATLSTFYSNFAGLIGASDFSTQLMCSAFAWTSFHTPANMPDESFAMTNSDVLPLLRIRCATYYDQYTAAQFKTALSGVMMLYPLATPTTIQLDDIELPVIPSDHATIYCTGGSAQPSYTMQYVQDTNLVIADLRAALADLATS